MEMNESEARKIVDLRFGIGINDEEKYYTAKGFLAGLAAKEDQIIKEFNHRQAFDKAEIEQLRENERECVKTLAILSSEATKNTNDLGEVLLELGFTRKELTAERERSRKLLEIVRKYGAALAGAGCDCNDLCMCKEHIAWNEALAAYREDRSEGSK